MVRAMTTNITAIILITLVTNVTEKLPQQLVSDPSPPSINGVTDTLFRGRYVPISNPREKWEVTTVTEVTTFQFNYLDAPVTARRERQVATWTKHFVVVPPEPTKWTETTNKTAPPLVW